MFAIVLIAGELLYCLRIPYLSVIEAHGHYKSTKKESYYETIINIIFSILLVNLINPLVAVATGTLVAMLYRIVKLAFYVDTKLLKRSRKYFGKLMVASSLIFFIGLCIASFIPVNIATNYVEWVIMAVITAFIISIIAFIVSLLFYKKETESILIIIKTMFKKFSNRA